MSIDVASRLRWFRKERGMLLRDAAAASGLSVSYISDIERGRTLPSLGAIEKLAAVYGFRAGVHFYEAESEERACTLAARLAGGRRRKEDCMSTAVVLRPIVQAFAEEMERKLLKNDHRGGWSIEDYEYIWRQLHEHLGKFTLHVYTDKERILPDGADVANLVMILCDLLGVLPE